MDLTPYVAELEDSLAAAAAAGDEETRRTAAALTAALEPAARLALMHALSDLALEVTDATGDCVVELRLEAGEVRVAVSPAQSADEESSSLPGEPLDLGGEQTRITLRLPGSLKDQAERAAAGQALSLNTWLTRVVQDALRFDTTAPGTGAGRDTRVHRVRGWVRP
jgi:predicted HicB family RNase H-like nuclease